MSGYDDYYLEEGCCFACEEHECDESGHACFNCKCTKCDHYSEGQCSLAMTWEEYKQIALAECALAVKRYGKKHTPIEAVFSNGRISRTIFYFFASDVPHQIWDDVAHRTLLLKRTQLRRTIKP